MVHNDNNKSLDDEIRILIKEKPKSWHTLIRKNANYKHLLDYITEQTPLLNDGTYRFVTRVYWTINHIHDWNDTLVTCRECGRPISKNPRFKMNGYGEFCSLSCCNKNKWHHENCISTSIRKYGTKHYTNRLKARQTCAFKYGAEFYTETKEFKEKTKITNMRKYNTDSPMKTDKVKQKVKATQILRYGEIYNKTQECKEKIRNTNTKKYGCEYYTQTKEYHEKCKTHVD